MKDKALTRRTWLRNTVHLAVIGAAPVLIQACKKAEFSCTDTSGLGEADRELRSSLEYTDRSPHDTTKSCASCAFYVVGPKDACGQCTILKGPIHPLGYCNSWAKKT